MILIGYSGHAFVIYGILKSAGKIVKGYCDVVAKDFDPFGLTYFGTETSSAALQQLKQQGFFIAVGNNLLRKKIYESLQQQQLFPVNAIHPSAVIDESAIVAPQGIMVAARVVINPLAKIHTGAICNTGCIIEHECVVGEFAHIGPGAVLCGNVTVGSGSFIGAGSVIRQGITIGKNVQVGAGAAVLKDVPDNTTVFGVPAK